jgi:hypothetical protein
VRWKRNSSSSRGHKRQHNQPNERGNTWRHSFTTEFSIMA